MQDASRLPIWQSRLTLPPDLLGRVRWHFLLSSLLVATLQVLVLTQAESTANNL